MDFIICGQNFFLINMVRISRKIRHTGTGSSAIRVPAAVSQGFRFCSQNPSNLPHATKHKSKAAEPSLRIP
jgi:hypothetical protein